MTKISFVSRIIRFNANVFMRLLAKLMFGTLLALRMKVTGLSDTTFGFPRGNQTKENV